MDEKTFPIRYLSHPSSKRVSSDCLSDNNPDIRCPYKFRSRSTSGIFNVCPWFKPFVSLKAYPYVWTFWLRNSKHCGSVLQFYLNVRGCMSCMTVAIWWSCNNIHFLRHLGRRRDLFSKKLNRLQSRLSQCHHGARLYLQTSVIVVLTAFLKRQMSNNVWFFCLFVLPE